MVINNLLIKLKNRDSKSIAEAKSVLDGLAGNIPVLLDSRVEVDIRAGESAYDIMLINTFASAQDIQTYLAHPVHVEVAKFIVAAMESSASLCYEVCD